MNAGNSRYIPPKAIEKDEIKHYLELIRDNGSVCPGAAAGVAKLRIKICLNDSARISESERAELNALKNNIRRSVPHSDLKDGGQRYETASAFTIALAPFLRAYHQQGVELSLRDENSSIGKILRAVGIDTTLALGEIADAVDKTFLRRDQFHKAMKDAGITLPGKGR